MKKRLTIREVNAEECDATMFNSSTAAKYKNKMIKYSIIFFYIIFISIHSSAQQNDSNLIHALLQNIASLQVKSDGEFYAGMFPTYRECGGSPHNFQPDNTAFYTVLSAFTLKNLLPDLSDADKKTAQEIIDKAQPVFPHYQNKDGFPYYNFWPTNSVIMPHSFYFKYLKSVFGEGEDADDAVMILMASNASDSICKILKKRLIEVSNLSKKKIISTYPKYRNIPAYSTYLGYRMTPDFDFAVHCNILYFMLEKKLPLVKQDSATIDLLTKMLKNREYMKSPVYLSPYYVKRSVLLYHISRLMGKFNIAALEPYKQQLIDDIKQQFKECGGIMDKIILNTSLLRLGSKPLFISVSNISGFEKSNQDNFIFFQARAAFSYPTPFKQIFLHWSYICYYFYCPAYYKILWLEYLVEKEELKN